MSNSEKVTAYIEKHSKWSAMLTEIRGIFQSTELVEEIKWGAPSYSINGKLVAGMAAFKNHMGIWFHKGCFLKDTHGKLLNAQEGKTKAMRQWRFEENDIIDKALVHNYIQEAIENSLAGKEIKPVRNKKIAIGPYLKNYFKSNPEFYQNFQKLTPGKQREYAEYIQTAKRESTRTSRLEKIIPMIAEGIGLNDKYKNC